ncbi:MAG: AAA family ATPase [Alphaproteobacteria bacterium GM7ARS4]|nr:AAA family ATPase [Alphaproteobacteria bacterium GM7ARS4]
MEFDRLEIVGFKSFYEPCTLTFHPELTAIVGPNGCGKSNIVDAIRWVMGETAPRYIRGGDMDDVIFAGTQQRPPRNIAEVTLSLSHVDTQHTTFPIKQKTIHITRSIERSKGSTWRCHNDIVRARDVRLLFADSATHARSSMMIGQGDIVQLIQNTPQARRTMLEEAAGIGGLNIRRTEAEQRLQASEKNLQHIQETLQQLKTRHHDIQRQAKHTKRYRTLMDTLREAERLYLYQQWQRAHYHWAQHHQRMGAHNETRQQLEKEKKDLQKRYDAIAPKRDHYQKVQQDIQTEKQQLERQRHEHTAQEKYHAQQQHIIEKHLKESEQEYTHTQQELEDIQAVLTEKQNAYRLWQREHPAPSHNTQETHALTELERRLHAERRALLEAQKTLAHMEEKKNALIKKAQTLSHDLATHEKTATIDDRKQRYARAMQERDASERHLNASKHALTQAEQHAQKTNAHAHALSSERTRIADKISVLEQWHSANLSKNRQPHAQPHKQSHAIAVQQGYEQALDAAFDDHSLDASSDSTHPCHWHTWDNQDTPPPLPPGIKSLYHYVTKSPPYTHRRLLYTGVVEENNPHIHTLHQSLKPGQRLVTKEGSLWRWDGYAKKDPAHPSTSWSKRQTQELEQLYRQQKTLAHKIKDAQKQQEDAQAHHHQARATLERAYADDQEKTLLCQQAQRDHEAQEQQKRQAQQEQTAIAKERPLIDAAIEQASAIINKTPLETLEQAYLEKKHRLQNQEHNARLYTQQKQEHHNNIDAWEQRKKKVMEHQRIVKKRWDESQKHAIEHRGMPAHFAKQKKTLDVAWYQWEKKSLAIKPLLLDMQAECQTIERRQRDIDTTLKAVQRQQTTTQQDLTTALEHKKRKEREFTITYGIEAETLMHHSSHDMRPPSDKDSARQLETLERLKKQRESLGNVNLLAEEQLIAIEKERTHIEQEYNDMTHAIAKLHNAITRINNESRQRLRKAFTESNTHFKKIFRQLFGGGTASMKLTDHQDLLESGVDIFVTPPGKKLQRISLLSGGEKTFAALALIFAFFLVKPPPICILDEVDAALDDHNTEKLCAFLRNINKEFKTRFIVITHNIITMRAMEHLYGITMAEPGVSQCVHVNLNKAEALMEQA